MSEFFHRLESKTSEEKPKKGSGENFMQKIFWTLASLLLLLVIIGGGVYFLKPDLLRSLPLSPLPVKQESGRSGYVAVFLTNNQIYFGKLSDRDAQYPLLREVYYFRVQRTIQPGETPQENVKVEKGGKKEPVPAPPPSVQNELTLIKLGNEIHGPVDEVQLNRDQILFIEELKEDSKVVKAIKDFKEKNK